MPSIAAALLACLRPVERPGDFCAGGTRQIMMPTIDVEGVGRLAFPLLPVQMERLVAVAEAAPYGRGEATLVDRDIRRTWQIDPARIRIGGRHWQKSLSELVADAACGIGVGDPAALGAALIDLLPGDPARPAAPLAPYQRPSPVTLGFVVDLLTATNLVDEALAARAIEHALAWPKTYAPDAVLVGAALAFAGQCCGRRASTICAGASRSRSRRRAIGRASAGLPVAATIVANLVPFWSIPGDGNGS
jgi:hypothetical protein